MQTARRRTAVAIGTLMSVAIFLGLTAIAMTRYPGGTWMNHGTRGHRFWANFLCDLIHETALNGEANDAALFARAAMLALTAGLLGFWFANAWLLGSRPALATVVRGGGTISVLGTVAVILTPTDRFGALHAVAVFGASVPGIAAALTATLGLWMTRPPRARVVGGIAVTTTGFAAVNAVQYAKLVLGGNESLALPAVQKVAAILLLVWMCAASFSLLRRAEPRVAAR